jgi:hypothetical protein
MNLNISPRSLKHSLLRPDDCELIEVPKIDFVTLKDYADRSGVMEFDFGFRQRLAPLRYEIHQRADVMFAKREPGS